MKIDFIEKKKNKFVGIRIPFWLWEKASIEANEYEISVNKYIANLVYTVLNEKNANNLTEAEVTMYEGNSK